MNDCVGDRFPYSLKSIRLVDNFEFYQPDTGQPLAPGLEPEGTQALDHAQLESVRR